MKRILMLLTMAAILSGGVAYSQISLGIKAGVNLQNFNGEDDDGDDLEMDLKPGFLVGADVEIPVAQDFYFRPGLLFSTKGAKEDDTKAIVSYIELPLHLMYKPQLGSGKIFIGLGPYVAYGISGKFKDDDGNEEDIEFTNDVKMDDDAIFFMKPLDAGADIFFGYEFAFKLSVQLDAQLGLLNLSPKSEGEDPEGILKNTGFSLSLGYRF